MRGAVAWLAVVLVGVAAASDEAPAWVRDAASAATPKYESKVPAVVLLDEQRVTIDDSGKRTITTHKVLRVLSQDGRREAHATEHYLVGSSKVKELHAWLLSPSGQSKQFGKDRVVDVAAAANDIYSDVRGRIVDASREAVPGSVFAYEAVSEDKSIFTQFEWAFQDRLPALISRFVLAMPAGWRAESMAFNTSKLDPAISGGTYTWEMRNLAFIEFEPLGPAAHALAPRMGVTFFPPGAVKNAGPSLASWQDVAAFQYGLAEDRQTTSAEMTVKTRELIAGANSEFDRIAAIGKYVQGVNYIAVQTNVGRGGGYRPHSASDVFAKSYGDCKDKANLMRTMLKIAGIDSNLTAIYSGDRTYVRAEWPSPHQFNHMIVAVRINGPPKAAAVLEQAGLGRLLFFDPTDDSIPLGYLPWHEQDSYALVIAATNGALVRMPVTSPASNRVEREGELSIEPDGVARVKLRERSYGETAAALRHQHARATPDEYRRAVERWLARATGAPQISQIQISPGGQAAEWERTVEYSTPNSAQTMQGRLMMVKPITAPFATASLGEQHRTHPILLQSQVQAETVRVMIPSGFAVDEVPDAVQLETSYGKYTTAYTVEPGAVLVKRALEVRATTVPAADYEELRTFFGRVLGSVQAPIVFLKK
jgi:transglutaminase-like putative cysteine protease